MSSPSRAEKLAEVVRLFQRRLYLPDPAPLLAVLGAVAANRLAGDPVWLLLVGPPGSGKSELLQSAEQLPFVHPAATITEAGLLSGTSRKDRTRDATGGLLRAVDKFGVIMCKDFGSVLSMSRDARQGVLAAFREIYDGSWSRVVGSDGGRTLEWRGKVGFIGGCTESIDTRHSVMAAMGERFILCRMPATDEEAQARRALGHATTSDEMRNEFRVAVARLLGSDLVLTDRVPPTGAEANWLINLAMLVARCRSGVERDGRTREIEVVLGTEAPARIAKVLLQLRHGLLAIGVEPAGVFSLLIKMGFDCMPVARLQVLTALRKDPDLWKSVQQIAEPLSYSETTVRRHLEELSAHGVVERERSSAHKADYWMLSSWTRGKLEALETVPETLTWPSEGSVPEKSGRSVRDSLAGAQAAAERGTPSASEDPHPRSSSEADTSGKVPAAGSNRPAP